MSKAIVLAYSGGLDTTFCAVYLTQTLGYQVHAVTINTGALSEQELKEMEQRALTIGVASFQVIDVSEQYHKTCIRYMIFGNVLKNGTYPLGVSSERVIQAISIADFAKKKGITQIAHGSTGAGNDQVRFDMAIQQLYPEAMIVTPIRDLQLSREQEIDFLRQKGVHFDFKKADYSINKGIWGTSVGGKETLQSHSYLPDTAWPTPFENNPPQHLTLQFLKGELIAINDTVYTHPVNAIKSLQALAQPYGIGRDIHVGDTIIGIKGRVGFEAAAPLILIKAHHLLEKHVLTKWQLFIKDQLSAWYGNWLHEGQLLEPVMRDIEVFFTNSQSHVSGKVFVTLMPHRFVLEGIDSPHNLMSDVFGSYGEMNKTWSGEDVKGFTKIFGQQTKNL